MAITLSEKFESRSATTGANAYAELLYLVSGTDDDQAIKTELETNPTIPVTYNGLPRRSIKYDKKGFELWLATISYSQKTASLPSPPTGGSVFSFDTGGGSVHITQSKATVNSFAPPGQTAPDYKGAIGVTENNIEGVDIVIPVYNFAEIHYIADADVTTAYRSILFSLTGKVNNAVFKEYAAGECLFLGASGTKRSEDDWEISYRFAASPNMTDISIGDIVNITKNGWEYLWVHYVEVEDPISKTLVKRPEAAYAEQVYDLVDFSQLGI